jgi:sarcosine oxidase subunit alpha
VHCTPVTTAYASINVAGPRSRELLGRLTDLDLDPVEFPYMHVRTATVADVADVVVWRIGFTGELSYELHVPASYGQHVWDALLSNGRDLGATAFGVEAQRILRLEKGHLVVGQDTDGLTQAFSAELGWAVRLDKEDFVGAPELRWQRDRGPTSRLVALQPLDPDLVPSEASQIVGADAEIIGRITSSRHSPTLDRSVCLGHLSNDYADPGTVVQVRLPGGTTAALRVCEHLAHYDPPGERVRG